MRGAISRSFSSHLPPIDAWKLAKPVSLPPGLARSATKPLPIGTKVNLHFTVIMDGVETIEGVGEVVRVEKDPPGMGVVFRELSGYSKDLIDKLLTRGIA